MTVTNWPCCNTVAIQLRPSRTFHVRWCVLKHKRSSRFKSQRWSCARHFVEALRQEGYWRERVPQSALEEDWNQFLFFIPHNKTYLALCLRPPPKECFQSVTCLGPSSCVSDVISPLCDTKKGFQDFQECFNTAIYGQSGINWRKKRYVSIKCIFKSSKDVIVVEWVSFWQSFSFNALNWAQLFFQNKCLLYSNGKIELFYVSHSSAAAVCTACS